MLGWHIKVSRQARSRSSPGSTGSRPGEVLAAWQADMSGLDWIEALCSTGDGVALGGDGYPLRYTLRAGAVSGQLAAGPPAANEPWELGEHDIVVDRDKWLGRTMVDHDVLASCSPDEWLLVEAWDES